MVALIELLSRDVEQEHNQPQLEGPLKRTEHPGSRTTREIKGRYGIHNCCSAFVSMVCMLRCCLWDYLRFEALAQCLAWDLFHEHAIFPEKTAGCSVFHSTARKQRWDVAVTVHSACSVHDPRDTSLHTRQGGNYTR